MFRVRMGLLACASLVAMALPAQGAVTVVGGGLAESCWRAVRAGQAERDTLNLCTMSLETEALRRRDRGGTFVNRGIVHLRLRDLDSALEDFARAERLTPTVGEVFVNRGAALISLARYGEAVAEIDRGIVLGIEEPEKAYYNRALAKEGQNDLRGAYADLRRAQEINPAWTLPGTQLARFTVVSRQP